MKKALVLLTSTQHSFKAQERKLHSYTHQEKKKEYRSILL